MLRAARVAVPVLVCSLVTAASLTTPAAPSPGPPRPAAPPSDGGWVLRSDAVRERDSHRPYVANGYLGQRIGPRGAGHSATGEKTGWPLFTPRQDGAFVAGLYAHDPRTADGRQVLAALPTWTGLNLTATDGGSDGRGETFSSGTPRARVSDWTQSLDLRRGLVRTSLTWTASDGRRTDLTYEVLADRAHAHAGAVRLRVTPHWSGGARVTDVLDGRGARRIAATGAADRGAGTMSVGFRADGTGTEGAVASTLRPGPAVRTEDEQKAATERKLTARQSASFTAERGRTYAFTKYVGVDTALTSSAPRADAVAASRDAAERGWRRTLAGHTAAWERLWRGSIEVEGRPELQRWIRSAQYGLFSATRKGADDSIAPTGLSSDNYAGLVFWDAETWMYPSLLAAHPELARSVLDYRYRTRAGARANAEKLGHSGLFYGWNTGSHGDLWKECHSWDPPHCRTQNHLQSDIALAVWQYYTATGDTGWLRERGWPLLKGIAAFWADRATRNGDGSFSVRNVAGPDEYSNGVDDGVFTNAGAATALRHAARAAELLGETAPARWRKVADGLRIPFDEKNGVFRQYAGYDGSLIKQADTVLLMYPLEWPMRKETAARTLDHYAARTDPDGPAMTDSVHAVVAAGTNEPGCAVDTYLERSVRPFMRGPYALFSEARGEKAGAEDPLSGSPAQDFLTGKGGFLQVFTNGLTGQRMREDRVKLDPMLPPRLARGVTLNGLRWQGRTYDIEMKAHHTTVRLREGAPFRVEGPRGEQTVSESAPAVFRTRRPDLTPTDDAARCQAARAGSEQPGMYARAAVDGSDATAWAPDGAKGTLTVRLARPVPAARIAHTWSGTKPQGHRTEVSPDGRHWRPAPRDGQRAPFRYVRTTVTSADADKPAGIAELRVTER
ncbi:glycosyl hydrolase family 65 protein [Streptomyces sp. HNM0574]|uniref:glycosyl hydrolase family 95 catalytic domain-containing protein n=1 Tax=Streptomyces sp. HNM0574 TaxID=2714954 RepID=UPI001469BEC9|nr:glycosyl hydrolase family 65 protein [Streptomyces sp. HNM0574]NLU66459.1 haloacid dehalogenase [Streptomyces sp. HNM0574]